MVNKKLNWLFFLRKKWWIYKSQSWIKQWVLLNSLNSVVDDEIIKMISKGLQFFLSKMACLWCPCDKKHQQPLFFFCLVIRKSPFSSLTLLVWLLCSLHPEGGCVCYSWHQQSFVLTLITCEPDLLQNKKIQITKCLWPVSHLATNVHP